MNEIVLFVNDKEKMSTFYTSLLGSKIVTSTKDFAKLESPELQLLIHGIPAEHQEPLSEPPVAREECVWKPIFKVDSIERIREEISALGGSLADSSTEWMLDSRKYCNGIDPEGNIIQFSAEVAVDQ